MNASEMTFGVEIETGAPASATTNHGLQVGSYYSRGIQVPYLPQGWVAKRDGSIRDFDRQLGPNWQPCEIVSPILKGEDGLRQVLEVCKQLTEKGHKVNYSTGVHVHVGWNRNLSQKALACLVTITAYLEKGLYAITGTHKRQEGTYCSSVRQYGNEKQGKKSIEGYRYHILNLTNLAVGIKETVEFRGFSGSTNPVKIIGWIQVCLGIVERALECKRRPSWNPKPLTGGWAKGGEGASETERLMGYLAWGNGYAAAHKGRTFGWLPGSPISQDEVKAEFRRLAKKYDAEVAAPVSIPSQVS